ncbi:MAG: glycosyltransferase [Candidatus Nanopelagicales bacterium]
MTTVSILMPAHNHARFLPESIGSVLAQTDPDWELLIMDDNSSDSTWEVLSDYQDPRIQVFHSDQNRGTAASINDLYRRSTGQLIAHLDADDRYRPEFIERQRAFLADNPDIEISGTYTCEIDAEGGSADQWNLSAWFNHQLDLNDPANWVWQNRLAHGSCMVRRRVYDDIGGCAEDLWIAVDWDLWVRALAAGHRFHVLPEALFEWRIHGDNMTNSRPAETVRNWSVTSRRTFHPYLDRIDRGDLKAQNIAGFLTHQALADQPTEYVISILANVLTGDPVELAEAVAQVAGEINGLRDTYARSRTSIEEAERLTAELSQARLERDALGDRLHAAEVDRRAVQAQLRRIQSTRLYRAARRVRHGFGPR